MAGSRILADDEPLEDDEESSSASSISAATKVDWNLRFALTYREFGSPALATFVQQLPNSRNRETPNCRLVKRK
jgi:hypothetical protein